MLELYSNLQRMLLRRRRFGAPEGAPVAVRKRKSAGGKNHLKLNNTRAGSSPQLCCRDVQEELSRFRVIRHNKLTGQPGNEILNPDIPLPRHIGVAKGEV